MQSTSAGVNRPLVGILSLVCLTLSLGIALFVPGSDASYAAFLRVGLVLAAMWIALPKDGSQMRWMKISPVLGLAVLFAFATSKGKVLVALLPILVVVGSIIVMLRPRDKRAPRTRR